MNKIVLSSILVLFLCACQQEAGQPEASKPVVNQPAEVEATIKAATVVPASGETTATIQDGANDPAIWVNAADPSKSLILGSGGEGGFELYGLDGQRASVLAGREVTLMSVRYNFPLADASTDLIVAYDAGKSQVVAYSIDGASGKLSDVTGQALQVEKELEGLCMYQSPLSLKYYVFAVGEGMIQQWELFDQQGKVAGRKIRSIPAGMGAGHCVAYDRGSKLFFAQETVGVWAMNAEPESDSEPQVIDYAAPFGHFEGDVKGLAVVEFEDSDGYLMVSNADISQIEVYQLDSAEHLASFSIGAASGLDAVQETEGLAAVTSALGADYPGGLLVVADDDNEGEATNYKLVSMAGLLSSLGLPAGQGFNPAVAMTSTVNTVSASLETAPVRTFGDAADDPAFWVHPDDPSLSLLLGTQKKLGLNVYDMSGALVQSLEDGRLNNVDVRYGFDLGGESVDLVTASNRTTDSINIYKVNKDTRRLESVADGIIDTGMLDPYGLCMYRNQAGQYFVYVNDTDGVVRQWELLDAGNGKVGAKQVREFSVGSQTEGCVADDDNGHLYIGEENSAIWKYSAEPDGGDQRTLVDQVDGGHIVADVEGLSLYYGPDGGGYLIASIQGADRYAIYERGGDNQFIGEFHVVADESTGIDGVSETDGLDVTAANLGPGFPNGAFIAQDGRNISPDERQNFKLVPWERIAELFGLDINDGYDPRTPDSQ